MNTFLDDLATQETCAIYNDLSHINPRYLTARAYEGAFHDEEVLYHKRSILLLTLFFDRIVICTDNILAFTRFMSKDVVTSVVTADWFNDLVAEGIIILAGWGSSINPDMMANQTDYSMLYRPELKDKKYIDFLSGLSERANWVVRETGPGEADHINFLRPIIRRREGLMDASEIGFLSDLIEHTHENVGYMGTMEMFPFVDELFAGQSEKADSFYKGYYESWHAYCARYYAPAIPIHTDKIPLPVTWVEMPDGNRALSSLFSPQLFHRYLMKRFSQKLISRLLSLDMKRLLQIRNGDWMRFKKRYHAYLIAASAVCWIAYHPRAHDLVADDGVMDDLLSEIFKFAHDDADISGLGSAIDVVLGFFAGFPIMTPIFALFKKQINKRVGRLAHTMRHRELEPYLKKLQVLLEKPTSAVIRP